MNLTHKHIIVSGLLAALLLPLAVLLTGIRGG